MSDMNNNNALILEGVYKGLSAKVDEAKESVLKELQQNAKDSSLKDTLVAAVREQLEPVLLEVQFMEQQINAVDEKNTADLKTVQGSLSSLATQLTASLQAIQNNLSTQIAQTAQALQATVIAAVDALGKRYETLDKKFDALREDLYVEDEAEPEQPEEAPVEEEAPAEAEAPAAETPAAE